MQLLLLDIMLFTLVTIASAHFKFLVSRKGKVITHFFGNEPTENELRSRASAKNCAALFGRCDGIRCCGNYELAMPGSPMTQIPPWMRATIKCSAASDRVTGLQIRYTKVIHDVMYDGPKDARYYAMKSRLNRYCLPRARKIWKAGK